MATAFLAWELGAGLSHLMMLATWARAFCARGHRVFAAVRNLSYAEAAFDGCSVELLQAPFKQSPCSDPITPVHTFAHVLHNTGFDDPDDLRIRAELWRDLLRRTKPGLILCEHSPTALLVARGFTARRVVVGNAFSCPPNVTPFPSLRSQPPDTLEPVAQNETKVLDTANRLLALWGCRPLGCLAELYADAAATVLMTLPAFDPFPRNPEMPYVSGPNGLSGQSPVWPHGLGKRVFVYTQQFPALEGLLETLRNLGWPTIVFGTCIPPVMREQYRSDTLSFSDGLLDMTAVVRTCDAAVLHGNHATTVSMLLAGKPILQIPLSVEQGLNAVATAQIGAGLLAPSTDATAIGLQLITLLGDDRFTLAARRFAASCESIDFEGRRARAVELALRLLES